MAELVLTDEEKAANSAMEWDNESIGRLVKKGVSMIHDNEDKNGFKRASWFSAALVLCGYLCDSDGEEMTQTCNGVTWNDKSVGDFEITVRRIK